MGGVAEACLPTPDSKKIKGMNILKVFVKSSSRKFASICSITNSTQERASHHIFARKENYYFVRRCLKVLALDAMASSGDFDARPGVKKLVTPATVG